MTESNGFRKFLVRAFRSSPIAFGAGALLTLGLVAEMAVKLPSWSGFLAGGPYVLAPKSELDAARHWQTLAASREIELEKSLTDNVHLTAAVNNRDAQMAWCKQHDELIASLWTDWKSLQSTREEQMIRGAPIQPSSHLLEDEEHDPLINSTERSQDTLMTRITTLMTQETELCNFGSHS
ncbi:hypothetical protein KTE69_24410 [Burkholderia multivorans]|uniref:hypothetical protein n=1 Tax=Burkholderia multivorans TaxID=87883 RepID=UPI001C234495|nr:hypothetical protein [Burkholderia multivorans]MBU9371494.1 hypothetical protein [Burkholderia multivorans]MBU9414483.1 hypothetical protein [Burkholderia multivorans]UXZ82462.1 hypothetical protein NUJ31_00045 [Burkholderia multivorans]